MVMSQRYANETNLVRGSCPDVPHATHIIFIGAIKIQVDSPSISAFTKMDCEDRKVFFNSLLEIRKYKQLLIERLPKAV
jgi:hypothetical protein